jgi:hypothetical protein
LATSDNLETMPKYIGQTLSLALSDLQGTGYAAGGDFPLGSPLPLDCLIVGYEIDVLQSVVGPGLVSASATVSWSTLPTMADLTTVGSYQNGGQQLVLSVALNGCLMALLTSGSIKVTVYYDRFTKTRFPPSPI